MDIVPRHTPQLQLSSNASDFDGLIGQSPPMRELRLLIDRAAASRLPVIIFGETGTGKELVASLLHRRSRRRDGPYVPFNGATLTASVAESELFGHRKGAFTDADTNTPGLLMTANGGSLFVDELTSMHLEVQAKLLRACDSGEVRPVGSAVADHTDVRLLVATNEDPRAAAEERRFRFDLLQRLHGIVLTLPPLARRLEDVSLLARHFLAAWAEGPVIPQITEGALARLAQYDYPGNVRELQMLVRRTYDLAGQPEVVTLEDIEEYGFGPLTRSQPSRPRTPAPRDDETCVNLVGRTLAEISAEAKGKTLRRFNGNKKLAAKALGIHRTSFNDLPSLQPRSTSSKRALGPPADQAGQSVTPAEPRDDDEGESTPAGDANGPNVR